MRLLYRLVLRRHLRAVLVVSLLVGLVAGVGMWSLGAARRTSSAYTRYLRAADASDVSVDVFNVTGQAALADVRPLIEEAAAIPGVVADATYFGFETMVFADSLFADPSVFAEFVGSLDGRFVKQDRIALLDGRLPDPAAPDEVLLNEVAAGLRGVGVGDVVPIAVYDSVSLAAPEVVGRFHADVVGIGVFPDDVLDDEYDHLPRVLLSEAGTRRWLDDDDSPYFWQGLRLEDPDEVPRVVAAYRELIAEDQFLITLVTADQVASAQRSVRPMVAALAVFGAATLAATLAVGAIAVARLPRDDAGELRVLRAMGTRPRVLVAGLAGSGVLAAALTAVVAAIVAVALSPLAPLGAVRSIEPDPGAAVDALVVAGGGALIGLALMVSAATVAFRTVRAVRSRTPAPSVSRSSTVVAALSPPAGIGARRGLGTSSTTGAPTRTALVGCAVSLAAIVAALTFGAALRQVVAEPPRYGWATDLALTAGGGYDVIDIDAARVVADEQAGVVGAAVAGYSAVEFGGVEIPALWVAAVKGDVPVTVLSGRLPSAPDEAALGRVSAAQLDAGIDDVIDGPIGALRVVGTVALPSIGPVTSAHPSLGDGVLLTMEALTAIDSDAQPSVLFLELRDGVDAAAAAPSLAARFAGTTAEGVMDSYTLLRPAELVDAEDAGTAVTVLAGLLGLAAVAGLATVVTASVRARRRELAVLRALGFTPADLRRSVRWQAATTAVVAAVLGVPGGLVAGVVLWRAFANTLGVDPDPVVPLALLSGAVVATVALAVATSMPAARSAAKASVITSLRPE